jgi:spermidine synthase
VLRPVTPTRDAHGHLGPPSEVQTIARGDSAVGEVVLRRRGDVVELIVGGVFVMDTVDVSTEIELATIALSRHPRPQRVLVGGLGLGFTTSTVLADERVERLVVAEIAAPLLDWARAGLLPVGGLRDPRVTLQNSDVAELLRDGRAEWDLILLDVDNGPGFLVRPENAELYAGAGLRAAAASLGPDGILAIWSSHRAPALHRALGSLAVGDVAEVVREVHRDGRELHYVIYLLTRTGAHPTDLSAPHTGE